MTKRFVITATNTRREPLSVHETIRKYGLTKADVHAVEAFLRTEKATKSSRPASSRASRSGSSRVVKFKRHSRRRSSSAHK